MPAARAGLPEPALSPATHSEEGSRAVCEPSLGDNPCCGKQHVSVQAGELASVRAARGSILRDVPRAPNCHQPGAAGQHTARLEPSDWTGTSTKVSL